MHIVEARKTERAILIGVVHQNQKQEDVELYLDELELLSDTAGLEVVSKEIQKKKDIDPAYYIGKGKVEALRELAEQVEADVIVFDDDLSPGQARNLERLCDLKILDRSGIILDIFALRAKSREAKTQVELAQLEYLLPRLTKMWTHLSRQTGEAGVGLRGPGEKQLEVDRRLVRKQITQLKAELIKIEKQRHIRRKQRDEYFKVALMGYTNVGKSTILNKLTNADVFVENRLFATLDSTVRRLPASESLNILLVDTVGFIRKLPHNLIASFKSTLEETTEADLLLHVVDISSASFREQMDTVKLVMEELKVSTKPILNVFNKVDKCDDVDFVLMEEFAPYVIISAHKNILIDDLKQKIIEYANKAFVELDIQIDLNNQREIAMVYTLAEVIKRKYNNGYVELKVRINQSKLHQLEQIITCP